MRNSVTGQLEIAKQTLERKAYGKVVLRPNMSNDEILATLPKSTAERLKLIYQSTPYYLTVLQKRSLLIIETHSYDSQFDYLASPIRDAELFEPPILSLIYLPGLRGTPERSYPMTAVGNTFKGTFPAYTASLILAWQNFSINDPLQGVQNDLIKLGLTGKVQAQRVSDVEIELKVGLLPSTPTTNANLDANPLVNIADVGLGVSQILPVLVALQAAKPGQLVYIEQPELHLHPRAQSIMAEILADAAIRGVQVVLETHSNLLLLGIQTLIAEGKLLPETVKLHWFQRAKDGSTKVTSASVDETGAFGDWPIDFADVSLEAQHRYLSAAENVHMRK